MRIALLCDVDQRVYHVGDEAIAHATAEALRGHGHDVVLVSRGEKHGPGGSPDPRSIPALTFPWGEVERRAYLDEIRRLLAGDTDALPADDKVHGIIARLREVDALVLGGGGSLNSRYGWLLSERAGMALIARSLGKPVILTGQSLGPALTVADRAVMAEMLEGCVLVGVRDRDSLALARTLVPDHPALVATTDDAALWHRLVPDELEDRITVTIAADPEPLPASDHARVVAAIVDAVAARTGAPVELVPHMADPDDGGVDIDRHREVAAQMRTPATLAPIELAEQAARRQMTARWVISTRFHPVVFATLSGASVLPLAMDRYGASRMDGALSNAGVEGGVVPLAALWDSEAGEPDAAAVDAVADALYEDTAAALAERRSRGAGLGRAAQAWMAHVAAVLAGSARPDAWEAPTDAPAVLEPRAGLLEDPRLAAWATAYGRPSTRERGHRAAADPSVSIVMRTRDRDLLLDRAVQDVLGQTRQDWELLIVNDCGDPTPVHAVVDRWAHEAAGRIRVLDRTESAGMESASNAGVEQTRAPLLSIHDDDDTWHAAFLQSTIARLERRPELVGVAVRTELVDERIDDDVIVEEHRHVVWPRMSGLRLSEFLAVNRIVPISLLYRRSAHDLVGAFREDLPVVGDYAFHLELLQRAELGFVERPLAQWRLRPRATGAQSNSMFALRDAHRHYDRELTEPRIREWLDRDGLGEALYMSRMVEEQLERALENVHRENRELRERVDALSGQLDDVLGILRGRGPREMARRVVRRLRR